MIFGNSTGIDIGLNDNPLATDAADIATTELELRDIETLGQDVSKPYDDSADTADKYLHLCQGTNSGDVDSATALSQGKYLIYIHGFVAPTDL